MKKGFIAVALLIAVAAGTAQAQTVQPATGSSSTVGVSSDSSTNRSTLDNVGQSGQGVSTGTRNEVGSSGMRTGDMSDQNQMKGRKGKNKNKNKNRRSMSDSTSSNQ